MSDQKASIWQQLEPHIKRHGLELFDIDMPANTNGVLRVFINRPRSGGQSLTADITDCTKVSKDILNLPQVEEIMPGSTTLEVSSPGINRKLTRLEHFNGAIGERVRLVVRKESDKKEVLRGTIKALSGDKICFDEESKKEELEIPFSNIQEARIDFLFS